MKNLEQLKLENECRKYWGAWTESNLNARVITERNKLWEIYLAGYLAGLESLDDTND